VSVAHMLPENVLTDEVAQYSPISLNKAKLLILSILLKRKKKDSTKITINAHLPLKYFLTMKISESKDEFLEERRPFIPN
jgi:hypothetical protein